MMALLAAIVLGSADPSLTLSAESRLRYDVSDRDPQQGLYRGILGADFRANPHLRLFAELGTGQIAGRQSPAGANFQNEVSLQQLFLDASQPVGAFLLGGVLGRQEFVDGPRQLVSAGDGPNLHRTWNGLRLYARGGQLRLGAFDLRGTRLGRGAFDDAIDEGERLQGLDASLNLFGLFVDPFLLHSENASRTGLDSYGLRLRGTRDALGFDWVLARQSGPAMGAWGLFALQTLTFAELPWKPRLGARFDLASVGFDQLYASSNYSSEGLFLSNSNLLLLAPSLALAPTPATSLSLEYGVAERLSEVDAVYAGLMRAYPGTQGVPGHEIGGLLRLNGRWSATENLALGFTYEHLAAGDVLQQARVPSGSYGYVFTTVRY